MGDRTKLTAAALYLDIADATTITIGAGLLPVGV